MKGVTRRILVAFPFIMLLICEITMKPWREVLYSYLTIIAIVWGCSLLYVSAVQFTLTTYFSKKTFNQLFKGVKSHGKERQEK